MKKNELISKRVQQLRLERGLNRQDFGSQIGVTPDYIRMIEVGTRHPSEGLVLAMCYRFHVNEKWLKSGIKSQGNGSRLRAANFSG